MKRNIKVFNYSFILRTIGLGMFNTLFNIYISIQDNLLIGLYFTIISLIRSYLIRRFFNKRVNNEN